MVTYTFDIIVTAYLQIRQYPMSILLDFSYSLAGFPREQKGRLDGLILILASSYFIKYFQKNTAK